jgi:hypothetical protein
MTKITLSIEVKESIDPAALGRWFEGWICDMWEQRGEPFTVPTPGPDLPPGQRLTRGSLHLVSVEAKPPASGRHQAAAGVMVRARCVTCGEGERCRDCLSIPWTAATLGLPSNEPR